MGLGSRLGERVKCGQVLHAGDHSALQGQFWDWCREARKLGREFTVTLQDVRDVYPRNHSCPACRVRMEHGTAVPATSPSIDGIDNALGYVPGNVHVICLGCNGRKRDLSLAELAARDDDLGKWARSHSERWRRHESMS